MNINQRKDSFLLKNAVALIIGYAALLIYASLFPFTGWRIPDQDTLSWLNLRLPRHISKSDFLVNVVAYIPLGFLVARRIFNGRIHLTHILLTTFIGTIISFSMELLQVFLPGRVSSTLDLLTNSSGTLIGALIWLVVRPDVSSEGKITKWRERLVLPGSLPEVGLGVICCWALSQLAPFAPSVDLGGIKNAIKPLWQTANNLSSFKVCYAVTYGGFIAALGIIAQLTAKRDARPVLLFAMFSSTVLFLKIFIMGRQLSLEALTGLVCGLIICLLLGALPRAHRTHAGVLLLLMGFTVYELKAEMALGVAGTFHWIPFESQMPQELIGMQSILEGIWPFAALSYLCCMLCEDRRRKMMTAGGAAVFCFVFALEWCQLYIPGRTADITQPLLAVVGWLGPFWYLQTSVVTEKRMAREPRSDKEFSKLK